MRARGLYVITDPGLIGGAKLAPAVEAALRGGAAMVQYRDKRTGKSRRLREVKELLALCRHYGVPLIVNDDVPLARQSGADGVHLGRDDADPAQARAVLGPRAMIGISCYDSLQHAYEAARAGADYVAFGSFFPSATKPDAAPASLELLHEARRQLDIPIAAIGGIMPDNGAALIRAGADWLAVIRGVFATPDIEAAARRYAALYTNQAG